MKILYSALLVTVLSIAGAGFQAAAQTANNSNQIQLLSALVGSVQRTGDSQANALTAGLFQGGDIGLSTQDMGNGQLQLEGIEIRPASNIKKAGETGFVAHTQLKVFIPANGLGSIQPPSMQQILASSAPGMEPATTGPQLSQGFETPASMLCVYDRSPAPTKSGCLPTTSTVNPKGGAGAIAIIEVYDSSGFVQTDLNTFSSHFGLPTTTVKVVYAAGKKPATSIGTGWDLETDLDVQWAHAMAPGAKIFLVEAASDLSTDVFHAVDVATKLVQENGGGQVSMSFSDDETPEELTYDSHFKEASGVVYVASAGDEGGAYYPSSSPGVVSVGGTTIVRKSNKYIDEVVWNEASPGQTATFSTGGGKSAYEPRPSYQEVVKGITGASRGTPDVAADADPGAWTYWRGEWVGVGGTSLSAPFMAGIINNAHSIKGAESEANNNSYTELKEIYANIGTSSYAVNFRDITQGGGVGRVSPGAGWCGPDPAKPLETHTGYDLCSGVGSPLNYGGK